MKIMNINGPHRESHTDTLEPSGTLVIIIIIIMVPGSDMVSSSSFGIMFGSLTSPPVQHSLPITTWDSVSRRYCAFVLLITPPFPSPVKPGPGRGLHSGHVLHCSGFGFLHLSCAWLLASGTPTGSPASHRWILRTDDRNLSPVPSPFLAPSR